MTTVRRATHADIPTIRYIQRETWLATYPNSKLGITKDDIAAQFAHDDSSAGQPGWLIQRTKDFDDAQAMAWVAHHGDQVVGYATAQKEGTQNRLNALYVLPSFHRKGIGSELFVAVVGWLGSDKPLCANVAVYNEKAILFYETHGFIKTGTFVSDEIARLTVGKTIPEIEMVKPVAHQ